MKRSLALSLMLIVATALLPAAGDARNLCAQGDEAILAGDWFLASEHYAEALRLNPAYLDARAGIARAAYELGEYAQALVHIRDARKLAPRDATLASLEAFVHIALGDAASARSIVAELLSREPYNRDALFAKAELDMLEGKPGEASLVYRRTLERYPDDKRALVSLAILSLSLGDTDNAWRAIQDALRLHPDDPRVYYHAAWMDSRQGSYDRALRRLEQSLAIDPSHRPARQLLASVQYRALSFDSSIATAESLIRSRRSDTTAWYIKARALSRLGRHAEAEDTLMTALSIDPEDEFLRMALGQSLVDHAKLEDPRRNDAAAWHFARAEHYRKQNLRDQALYEYERGLRIAPYAAQRARYADLLGSMGLPARQLEELAFMQDIGISNTVVNDAVEAWDSLLADSLHRQWNIDPLSIGRDSWKLSVLVLEAPGTNIHVDAIVLTADLLKDVLRQSGGIDVVETQTLSANFAAAWRCAREAGADYFLLLSASESPLDFSLKTAIHSARTGSLLEEVSVYHTGMDKVRNATRKTLERVSSLLPFRSRIIARQGNRALVGTGRIGGLKKDMALIAVSSGALETETGELSVRYPKESLVANLIVEEVDEYVAQVRISRVGFFDRLMIKDHVLMAVKEEAPAGTNQAALRTAPVLSGEVRSLIRSIR